MELNDFANLTPWLILADKLESMFHHIPVKTEADASIFSAFEEESNPYTVKNGVAIIPIVGTMFKRPTFFSRLFGDRSMIGLTRSFLNAVADKDVKAIVLDVDSPGGTVSGTEAFGDIIYNARGKKPIVAFANGTMCSAAYWAASGADKIVAESTASVGSIGVVLVHHDWSKADERFGLKRTVITAGQFKAIGNDTEPLSDKARNTIQNQLDYLYDMFVHTVARNRGISEPQARTMAQGKVFIGQQAVEEGLADNVGSIDSAVELALEMAGTSKNKKNTQEATKVMDLNTLKEKHPELVAQIQQDASAEADGVIKTLQDENAALKANCEKLETAKMKLEEELGALQSDKENLEKDNKELGKRVMSLETKDLARDIRDAKADAQAVFKDKLAASRIPDKFYSRVMRGISFEDFFKDGKFDSDGYGKAVADEIADWEGDFKEGDVQGMGFTERDESGETEVAGEDALVDELAGMAGEE